ncbi:MAG TPA: MiaB/RimO family radical SAM methylthiotransferase [Thermoanaerobaculia bacterium]|nr:MiaB/RimO family radical SAM methylthiotransferase [Thermoanaerobaculia bacterium]
MYVYFTNLGCKLNQAEIESLAREFLAAGHSVAGSLEEADLHVVNSCTVTHVAARGSRKAAGRGRRAGLPLRTVLTGCWVTAEPEEAARLAGVDLVVANPEKDRLLEHVHRAFPELALPEVPVPYVPLPFGNTRALLKVEDGCNMRCAFCIIPSTRGRQRSRPPAELVEELKGLVRAGYREIVVTGVQISAYRSGADCLHELTRALLAALPSEEDGGVRLRLTSIAPWDLPRDRERLLGLWTDRRLCRHLHLSLQSGSATVLRRMRRPYTAEGYLRLLERVRAAIPGVAITTDVIAGFPGETAAEHAESLATVEAAGFAKVHVFPFSARPGTEAADMPGQIGPEEKKARVGQLLEAAARAEAAFRRAHLGQRATVLWEKPRDGMGHGLTDNYLRVLCRDGAALWNRWSEVELVGLAEEGMVGEIPGGPSAPDSIRTLRTPSEVSGKLPEPSGLHPIESDIVRSARTPAE